MKKALSLALVLLTASLSGCVYTSYNDGYGRKLTRVSLFGNQSVGKVDLTKGTMEGYVSEQANVAAMVVEAAVKGALANKPLVP